MQVSSRAVTGLGTICQVFTALMLLKGRKTRAETALMHFLANISQHIMRTIDFRELVIEVCIQSL